MESGDVTVSLADGWGGGTGFVAGTAEIAVVGVSTPRANYRPGECVTFAVVSDVGLTNVSDTGTVRLFDGQDRLVMTAGEGPAGVFDLPTDLPPGRYRLETERGSLSGSFAVSDVSLLPEREIYPLGGTLTVATTLDGLTATLITPSGERSTYEVDGTTDIPLTTDEVGDHNLVVRGDGVLYLRRNVHITVCDLWLDTNREIYEPGAEVKVHFAVRDIGVSIGEVPPVVLDLVCQTPNGTIRVSKTLQQTSGALSFITPADVLPGDVLWPMGRSNRIEIYLNVSAHQVSRCIPLVFSSPGVDIDVPVAGDDEEIMMDLTTGVWGRRPVWSLTAFGDTIVSRSPPVRLGTDPSGRAIYRVDRAMIIAESVSFVPEEVEAPVPYVRLNYTVGTVTGTVVTDRLGMAVVRLDPMPEGQYEIHVMSVDGSVPPANHILTVTGAGRTIVADAPMAMRAGDTAKIAVGLISGGEEVQGTIHYVVSFGGLLLSSGTVEDRTVTVTAPDADSTMTITLVSEVDGVPVTAEHDIEVVTSPIYLEHVDGEAIPDGNVTLAYAFLTDGNASDLSYSSPFGNGSLDAGEGTLTVGIPSTWDGSMFRLVLLGYDGLHRIGTAITLMRPPSVSISEPSDYPGGIAVAYASAASGEGTYIEGRYRVISQDGSTVREGLLDNASGILQLDLPPGAYSLVVRVSYLRSDGICQAEGTMGLYVAPSEGGAETLDLGLYLTLVLLVVIAGLVIVTLGTYRRAVSLGRRLRNAEKRAAKISKRLRSLENLIPSEEGHVIEK
ncbi:MAG TPA: hypothetical protein EYP43_02695, partial [Thermoplasmata archaeon]|nr:hypothetical protein [Thermoplasmata archaeon]